MSQLLHAVEFDGLRTHIQVFRVNAPRVLLRQFTHQLHEGRGRVADRRRGDRWDTRNICTLYRNLRYFRRCYGYFRRCYGYFRRCYGYFRRCYGYFRRCYGYFRRCYGYFRRCYGYFRRCYGRRYRDGHQRFEFCAYRLDL
ncbi:MAG: hypothetical protein [Edwardsiella phage MSW-3]|nr:MAG: hypothetical protein [Edwardsiella phage MSW-3]